MKKELKIKQSLFENKYELETGKKYILNEKDFAKFCYWECSKIINKIKNRQPFSKRQLMCLQSSIEQYKKGNIYGVKYPDTGALHELTEFLLDKRKDYFTIDAIIVYMQLYNLYTINNAYRIGFDV